MEEALAITIRISMLRWPCRNALIHVIITNNKEVNCIWQLTSYFVLCVLLDSAYSDGFDDDSLEQEEQNQGW